jgi:hypothetical protein
MDEISVDRLVIDIPGINAAQARKLAQHVGAGIATASRDNAAKTPVSFDTLSVDLNGLAAKEDIPRLAEAIISALLIQMGGR